VYTMKFEIWIWKVVNEIKRINDFYNTYVIL